ncbi:MAG TPA: hypothetical protein VET27_09305 [Mycobacterium sp.]|nr:hypothetical protein [Mycobacterium sp.]
MRKNLIDAATEHDVTGQQHRHHIRITDHAEPPAATTDTPHHEQYSALPEAEGPSLRRMLWYWHPGDHLPVGHRQ